MKKLFSLALILAVFAILFVLPENIKANTFALPMTCGGDTYYTKNFDLELWKKVSGVGTEYKINKAGSYLDYETPICCANAFYFNQGSVQHKILPGQITTSAIGLGEPHVQPQCYGNDLYWKGLIEESSSYSRILRKSFGSVLRGYEMGTDGDYHNSTLGTCSQRPGIVFWSAPWKICQSAQGNPAYSCLTTTDTNPIVGECVTGTKGYVSNTTHWTCQFSGDCNYKVTSACPIGKISNQDGACVYPRLTVTKVGGGGSNVIISDISGINCGSTCNFPYDLGATINLSVSSSTGSIFNGWSGDCAANGRVTMSSNKVCLANFSSTAVSTTTATTTTTSTSTRVLTVTKDGTGSGTVTGAGISCGSTCSYSYEVGATVTLTATPSSNSVFTGWDGDCNDDGQVYMSAARTCIATFDDEDDVADDDEDDEDEDNNDDEDSDIEQVTLDVYKAGTGAGVVTGSGISCGSTCSQVYDSGYNVLLMATPSTGSTFVGWSGNCNSSGRVTMNSDRTCVANFSYTPPVYTTVTVPPVTTQTYVPASTFSPCRFVELLISINVIAPYNATAARTAFSCTTSTGFAQ